MRGPYIYLILVFVMLVWGFNVVAIKIVVSTFSVVTITALRILTAFLALLPMLLYRKLFRVLTKKEFLYVFGIGLFGVLGHHFFLSTGLKLSTAANGGLILGAVPIATSIAAVLFLGDKVTISRVLGLLFGFSGVATIMLAGSHGAFAISIGDIYLCLAVVTQAISFIMIKKVSKSVDTAYITGISQFMGAIMLLSLSFMIEPGGLATLKGGTSVAWIVFFASGIIATGLGHLLYNKAIQQIGAGEAALFLNLSPFFALVGAALFLGERIVIGQWLGFILIVAGVLLGSGIIEQLRTKQLRVKDVKG